jgi:hypothetical protein
VAKTNAEIRKAELELDWKKTEIQAQVEIARMQQVAQVAGGSQEIERQRSKNWFVGKPQHGTSDRAIQALDNRVPNQDVYDEIKKMNTAADPDGAKKKALQNVLTRDQHNIYTDTAEKGLKILKEGKQVLTTSATGATSAQSVVRAMIDGD